MNRVGTRLALVAGLTALISACGGGNAAADRPLPPGWQKIEGLPGAFYDVYTFCDHGNRLYADTHNGVGGVAAQDPTCQAVK